VLALLLFAWAGGWGPPTPAAERPNIVFILADDLGYGDVGCYNPESKIPTPHLDRLAREGIRLTDAHSPASVCTPTRYALLTGRYAWRSRLKRGVLGPWSPPLIEEGRLTVASLLRQHGYATACIGKWHLGWQWPTKDGQPPATGANRLSNVDFTQPIAAGPTTRGFDDYFGTDVPNYPPFCHIENDRTVGIPSVVNWPHMNVPGPMLPGWNWINVLPEHAARAVRYIDEHRQAHSDQPFFLYLPLTSPHYPVVPDPAFRGASRAGKFGDFVAQTDDVVGQILDALARAGAAENTLVFFTSDNGPEITGEVQPGAYDRLQQYGHASMGSLRGAKRDLWEGGHRVPFLARWPGRIPAGSTSDATVSHVDFFATVAAMVGETLPPDAAEDSFNILPVLRGKASSVPTRRGLVHHSASGRFAIRSGSWVLIDAPTGDDNGRRGEPPWFKQTRGYQPHDQPGELYDLASDPRQRDNQYAQQPQKVAELRTLLENIRTAGRSR
jgi:arylsulfatase A-like enzyme